MAITRRALLISGPGQRGARGYLEGCKHDIAHYERHLFSAQGGAWEKHEVNTLESPRLEDVRQWLKDNKQTTYTFIMFTGHGAFSTTDIDPIIELRDGHEMSAYELRSTSERRTLILDSCQVLTTRSVRIALNEVMAKADSAARSLNRERCRKKFEEEISAVSNSVLALYSCSPGEVSYDDPDTGGYYNSSLIGSIDAWVQSKAASLNYGTVALLPAIDAHVAACPKVHNLSANQQHPKIGQHAKLKTDFPIAVIA